MINLLLLNVMRKVLLGVGVIFFISSYVFQFLISVAWRRNKFREGFGLSKKGMSCSTFGKSDFFQMNSSLPFVTYSTFEYLFDVIFHLLRGAEPMHLLLELLSTQTY